MKFSKVPCALVAMGTMLSIQSACTPGKPQVLSYPIGQRVQVGRLFYQVLEAQWTAEALGAKLPPKNRILQLHISVTNTGAQVANLPFLRLMDAAGKEIAEISELDSNPRWLGALRRVQPAATEEGLVYFDVPVGAYRLEVVDNSIADDEKVAYIEIPAGLAPPPHATGANGI